MIDRLEVWDKTQGECAYCGLDLNEIKTWHVEHQTPVSRGGTDNIDNLWPACPSCNIAKGSRTADEWLAVVAKRIRAHLIAAMDGVGLLYSDHQLWYSLKAVVDAIEGTPPKFPYEGHQELLDGMDRALAARADAAVEVAGGADTVH